MREYVSRSLRLAGALLVSVLAFWGGSLGDAAAQSVPSAPISTAVAPASQAEVDDLKQEVRDLRAERDRLLTPLSVLIGLLAAGGVVGIVTTFRNESRSSQLHEMAIGAETAAQRRTEESYTTFLDASQKTLTLVNDTLALAKESSERAATTMQQKAKRALDTIEQEAAELLDAVGDDLKGLVTDPSLRARVRHVANDLGAIEGYLMLQDIDITAPCLWIKGMDLHLSNDARGAQSSLRRAAQEATQKDLKVLSMYWLGYIQNNAAHYTDAGRMFREARAESSGDSPTGFELDRILLETEFFQLADTSQLDRVGAAERLAAVSHLLARLLELQNRVPVGAPLYAAADRAIASTRANVLTWAAAGSRHPDVIRADSDARNILVEALDLYRRAQGNRERLWPLFGITEATFLLSGEADKTSYERLEQLVVDDQRVRSEPRNSANLAQAILIIRLRLAGITDDRVRDAYARVQQTLSGVEEELTIFSQIQKRNLLRKDFEAELSRLVFDEPEVRG